MKKLFLFTVLFTIAALSFAQERETEKSASEAVRFEKSVGSLIKKDFYNLVDAENDYKVDVLILTNVLSGAKVGCLRWENRYRADYMSSSYIPYIGTLDFDELDAAIQSLTYIRDTLLPTVPDNYTEVVFESKDGMMLGAYFDNNENKWTIFVRTKSYTQDSTKNFRNQFLPKMIEMLINAKSKIQEFTR